MHQCPHCNKVELVTEGTYRYPWFSEPTRGQLLVCPRCNKTFFAPYEGALLWYNPQSMREKVYESVGQFRLFR